MRSVLQFFLCLFAASVVYGAEDTTLIVGTNAEFPPFTFVEEGKIVGFDIDVAQEVCKRLNKKLQIKDLPFEALIPELSLGQVQLVAAGISYSEDRAKRVSFVKAHLTNDPLIVLAMKKEKDGAPKKEILLSDLTGKKVIVNEGYTADLYASTKPGLELIRLTTTADAFMALKSGRADYFITARSTFNAFALNQPIDQFRYNVLADNPENYSLIVSKKRPELYEEIQKTMQGMIADGTVENIKKKWHLND